MISGEAWQARVEAERLQRENKLPFNEIDIFIAGVTWRMQRETNLRFKLFVALEALRKIRHSRELAVPALRTLAHMAMATIIESRKKAG